MNNRNLLIALALTALTSACAAPAPAVIDTPEPAPVETTDDSTDGLDIERPEDTTTDDDGTTTDGTDGTGDPDCLETTIEWIPEQYNDSLNLTGATDGVLTVTSLTTGEVRQASQAGAVTSLMVVVDSCMGPSYKIEGYVYNASHIIPDHVGDGKSYLVSFGFGWDVLNNTCDTVHGGTFLVDGSAQLIGGYITVEGSDNDGNGVSDCTDGDSQWFELDQSAQ